MMHKNIDEFSYDIYAKSTHNSFLRLRRKAHDGPRCMLDILGYMTTRTSVATQHMTMLDDWSSWRPLQLR